MKAFSNHISNDAIKIPEEEILLALKYSKLTYVLVAVILFINLIISGLFGYIIIENWEHYTNLIDQCNTIQK